MSTENLELKWAILLQRIKDNNIFKVQVNYSGGGDDGCIDDVYYQDINEDEIDTDLTKEELDELMNLYYKIISKNVEYDWVNNEGGWGMVNIKFDETFPKVIIEHTQNMPLDFTYESEITKNELENLSSSNYY